MEPHCTHTRTERDWGTERTESKGEGVEREYEGEKTIETERTREVVRGRERERERESERQRVVWGCPGLTAIGK